MRHGKEGIADDRKFLRAVAAQPVEPFSPRPEQAQPSLPTSAMPGEGNVSAPAIVAPKEKRL
uniref:hypothetical protein n=1 Tax=Dyella sedimenti TaxID=2919947 RepID=UPI001FAB1AA8